MAVVLISLLIHVKQGQCISFPVYLVYSVPIYEQLSFLIWLNIYKPKVLTKFLSSNMFEEFCDPFGFTNLVILLFGSAGIYFQYRLDICPQSLKCKCIIVTCLKNHLFTLLLRFLISKFWCIMKWKAVLNYQRVISKLVTCLQRFVSVSSLQKMSYFETSYIME